MRTQILAYGFVAAIAGAALYGLQVLIRTHAPDLGKEIADTVVKSLKKEKAAEVATSTESNAQTQPTAKPPLAQPKVSEPPRIPNLLPDDPFPTLSNAMVLAWGRPLMERINRIDYDYRMRIDEARKNPRGSTPGEQAQSLNFEMSNASSAAVQNFQNCCVDDAIKYRKALISRLGGGTENKAITPDYQMLNKPFTEIPPLFLPFMGGKIGMIDFDLQELRRQLREKIKNSG